jgi:integrase/recombinase XerD
MVERHEIETLGELYLSEKKFSKRTLKAYKGALKMYASYLKVHDITYAKTSDVIKYRAYRKSLGHSSPYIYIHFSFLKGFYRYLKEHAKKLNLSHHYQYDIMAPIKNEKMNHHIHKRILTVEEAKDLIMRTKDKRKEIWEYRDHAMIFLMLTSGLRAHEMIHTKRAHYQDLNDGKVLYIEVEGKFDETSFVKVSKGAKKAIDDYLKLRDDDNPYLFISHKYASKTGILSESFFQHMFKRLLKRCGLEDLIITAHVLVHTAALINLKRGGSLVSTQVLMRHKSIKSTMIYEDYLLNMTDHQSELISEFILRETAAFDFENLYYFLTDEVDDLLG